MTARVATRARVTRSPEPHVAELLLEVRLRAHAHRRRHVGRRGHVGELAPEELRQQAQGQARAELGGGGPRAATTRGRSDQGGVVPHDSRKRTGTARRSTPSEHLVVGLASGRAGRGPGHAARRRAGARRAGRRSGRPRPRSAVSGPPRHRSGVLAGIRQVLMRVLEGQEHVDEAEAAHGAAGEGGEDEPAQQGIGLEE